MSDGSHAARNAVQLREIERKRSHALVRSHNALITMLDERHQIAARLLDGAQLETLDDALDQIEAVADSLRTDDRLLGTHDRLLASRPEREALLVAGGSLDGDGRDD